MPVANHVSRSMGHSMTCPNPVSATQKRDWLT
jgi:hypothetical protein